MATEDEKELDELEDVGEKEKEEVKPSPPSKGFSLLNHSFPVVNEQVRRGIASAQRVAKMLTKVAQAKDSYLKKILEITKEESVADMREKHGEMPRYAFAVGALMSNIENIAKYEQDFSNKLMTEVVEPINTFCKDLEAKRKTIQDEEKELTKEQKKSYDALVKARQTCLKTLEMLKEAEQKEQTKGGKSSTGPSNPNTPNDKKAKSGLLSSLKSKLGSKTSAGLRDELHANCVKYEQTIRSTNTQQSKYYSEHLPKILSEMQELEELRIKTMKIHFQNLKKFSLDQVQPIQESASSFDVTLRSLDCGQDITDFVEATLKMHGPPTIHEPFNYDVPCTPDDIKEGKLEGRNPNSVLRSTLEHIMKRQEKAHPDLDVPLILVTLADAIRDNHGLERAGIFRESAPKAELDQLRNQIDEGKFTVKSTNPDIPASMLKLWLRELKEPLVIATLYQPAVELAAREKYDNAEVLALFKKLPDCNQRVINYLAELLGEVSSEEYIEITRMPLSNLAIIFSPAFLRNPSEDFLEMLNSSKLEIRFTDMLLSAILEREEVWKVEQKKKEESSQKAEEERIKKQKEFEVKNERIKAERARRKQEREEKAALRKLERAMAAQKETEAKAAKEAEKARLEQEAKERAQREAIERERTQREAEERARIEREFEEFKKAKMASMGLTTSPTITSPSSGTFPTSPTSIPSIPPSMPSSVPSMPSSVPSLPTTASPPTSPTTTTPPPFTPSMPTVTPTVPAKAPTMPSLPPTMPSLPPTMPSLPPTMPSLPPTIPSLPPSMPSLPPTMPSLPPTMPSLPPTMPSLPPTMPSMPPTMPSMPPTMPPTTPAFRPS